MRGTNARGSECCTAPGGGVLADVIAGCSGGLFCELHFCEVQWLLDCRRS